MREYNAIVGATDRVCVVTAVPDESKGERLVVLHTGMDVPKVWKELNGRGLPNASRWRLSGSSMIIALRANSCTS